MSDHLKNPLSAVLYLALVSFGCTSPEVPEAQVQAAKVTPVASAGALPPASPEVPVDCTHRTTLKAGIPGSPGHLIETSYNPNGASELSVLMREMLDAMKERREVLMAGGVPKPFPDYTKMKCSWPTVPSDRSAKYDAMADNMLGAIEGFNKDTTKSDAYQEIVRACVSCHQNTCPGPIRAIRPLALPKAQRPLPNTDGTSCETEAP